MQTPETIKLLGGTLCLDFVNSVDYDDGEPLPEYDALAGDDAVARWGRRVGLWTAATVVDAGELAALRALRPALRAALIAAADAPVEEDLATVSRDYAEAVGAARLSPAAGAYRLDWPADDLRRVRFAVVADAVALLADAPRLARVHVCPGRRCGWLFLDTSGRRRWCSMQTCGSRAKMRRLYERRRPG